MIESDEIKHRLNLINQFPLPGVGDLIAHPKLVVCGEQSAGKSSVLEAVTDIPFTQKDGLPTRFATEIVIRHAECEQTIKASIVPHGFRDKETADALRSYSRTLSGYDDVPDAIEEVAQELQLRGSTENEYAPTLAPDVLRIEVTGYTGIHLTIVDLPGLVPATEDEELYIRLVREVVDLYLADAHTTILAVIPAGRDIETQEVLQRARHFDRYGERTVGVFTKADLVGKSIEEQVARRLRIESSSELELGFFLLKYPRTEELTMRVAASELDKIELDYFQQSRWSNLHLDPSHIGAGALRSFIESMLEKHLEKELPKVHSEISRQLSTVKKQLEDFGEPRNNLAEQRLFLSELSTTFTDVFNSAVNGTYWNTNTEFFAEAKSGVFHNRLRAHVHRLNSKFANYMRDRSQKRQIRKPEANGVKRSSSRSSTSSRPTSPRSSMDTKAAAAANPADSLYEHLTALGTPTMVSKQEYYGWMMEVYKKARRPELPGNWNHALLMELFNGQSSRWGAIAEQHIKTVHKRVMDFVDRALAYVVKEDHIRMELRRIINPILRTNLDTALEELRKIVKDEQVQAITYSDYFNDTVQKAKQERMRDVAKRAFQLTSDGWGDKSYLDNIVEESTRYFSSPITPAHADLDMEACEEASTALSAYYKVAMTTFSNNVHRQVVERHIVGTLPSVFNLNTVLKLSDADIARIAAEPKSRLEKRQELTSLASTLAESLDELQNCFD